MTTFSTEAEPSPPVCRIRRPMIENTGSARSNTARSQPAKMAMLPLAARWHPPETGQSSGSAPTARTLAPRRSTSAWSVVLISAHIFPGPSAPSRPSSASTTSALAAGFGRHVTTRSQRSAISRGLSAQCAPASSTGWAAARSRSRTVRSTPLRSSDPARAPPTLPSPMKPTVPTDPTLTTTRSTAGCRRAGTAPRGTRRRTARARCHRRRSAGRAARCGTRPRPGR